MKIIQIGMGWFPEQPGGLNRVFYGCTQHLPKVGIELIGLVAGSNATTHTLKGKVQAFASRDSSLISRWISMRRSAKRLITQTTPDLLVSHFALYSLPILPYAKRCPMVMHFHGPWALEGGAEGNSKLITWMKKQIELPTYRRANSFIVLSNAFRQVLHREYAIPLKKIFVVPGGIDVNRFNSNLTSSEARKQLKWSQDRPILFTVRRLAKRMGLENLIDSMAEVHRRHPDALLLIAGKGNLQNELQGRINTLGLQDSVKLIGFLPDDHLPLAYRAANFSVVPTVELEGFGLVVIESLAAGTPVMGTPVGGIPEILEPLSKNLLFEGTSSREIALGINEVLKGNVSLPSESMCQTYVKENYAWPIVAKKMKAVYEQTLKDGNK